MKRALTSTFISAALALAFTGPVWAADTLDYPADTTTTLQDLSALTDTYNGRSFGDNALAPAGTDSGKSTSLSGNTITLSTYGVADPASGVTGALNTTTAEAVTHNTVNIGAHVKAGGVSGDDYGIAEGGSLWRSGGTLVNVSVSGNTVNAGAGAVVDHHTHGGNAQNDTGGSATASGNNVNVTVDAYLQTVIGGYAWSAAAAIANDNQVSVNGDDVLIDGYLYSGYAEGDFATVSAATPGSTSGNGLTLTAGTVRWIGGAGAYAGTGNALATYNWVQIIGGKVEDNIKAAGNAESHDGAAEASNNLFEMTGGEVGGTVYVGDAQARGNGAVIANNNTASIKNGVVGKSVSAAAYSDGGSASADSNTTLIEDSAVGSTEGVDVGSGGDASAQNNTVEIKGSSVVNGFVRAANVYSYGTATASGNTVSIVGTASGDPDLSASDVIGGLAIGADAAHSISTGNALNLNVKNLNFTVASVTAFQNLNLTLPTLPASPATDDAALVINGDAFDADTTVTVTVKATGLTVKTGDTFTLVHAANGFDATTKFTPSGTIGGYSYTLAVKDGVASGSNLVATIGSLAATGGAAVPTLNEWALALLALMLAGVAWRRRV